MNDPQDPTQQDPANQAGQGSGTQDPAQVSSAGTAGAQQGATQQGGQGVNHPTPPTPPNPLTPPAPPTPPATGQPPGGTQPTGGQPVTGQTGQKDLSGIMEENVDVSSLVANAGQNQQDSQALTKIPIPPHPNTRFDEQKFLHLLAGSISLTIGEKKRIIESIPKLSQFQIDELMKIFEEEKGKFAELEKKHADQISELEKQHAGSWQDLEAQKEEEDRKAKEAAEAQAIMQSLGGGQTQNDNTQSM